MLSIGAPSNLPQCTQETSSSSVVVLWAGLVVPQYSLANTGSSTSRAAPAIRTLSSVPGSRWHSTHHHSSLGKATSMLLLLLSCGAVSFFVGSKSRTRVVVGDGTAVPAGKHLAEHQTHRAHRVGRRLPETTILRGRGRRPRRCSPYVQRCLSNEARSSRRRHGGVFSPRLYKKEKGKPNLKILKSWGGV